MANLIELGEITKLCTICGNNKPRSGYVICNECLNKRRYKKPHKNTHKKGGMLVGYIYAIYWTAGKLYKIGWACDTDSRLKQNLAFMPFKPEIVFNAFVRDPMYVEAELHKMLHPVKQIREWYKIPMEPELVKTLCETFVKPYLKEKS
jgi:hypothetical protein